MQEFFNRNKNALYTELFQKKNKTLILLDQIINSKRLLCEHLDSLENIYSDFEKNKKNTNYFTIIKVITLGITSYISTKLLSYKSQFILSTITASYLILFGIKSINVKRNSYFENDIEKLLKAIDNFEICIKRNSIYFNSLQYYKSNSTELEKLESENELFKSCLQSIIFVTKVLYNELNQLEKNYPLPTKYNHLYESMENLNDCEYFSKTIDNFTIKDLKTFYHIFSYIQSQFLLRLGFSFLNSSILIKISPIINQINQQTNNDIKRLDIILENVSSETKTTTTNNKINNPSIISINNLKNNSIEFTSKIIALTLEIRKSDIFIQNINNNLNKIDEKKFIDFSQRLNIIETSMSICNEEFHRLILNYQNFLNVNYKVPFLIDQKKYNDENLQILNEEKLKNGTQQNLTESTQIIIEDDFFGLDGILKIDDNEEATLNNYYDDLININSKITKSYYKPVLNQLKEKIIPIGRTMKIKERNILSAKGIQIENYDDDLVVNKKNSCSSDESNNDEDDTSTRRKRTNKYDEDRKFLINKQQQTFLPNLPYPTKSLFDEEILE